jgi:hypothetical protein
LTNTPKYENGRFGKGASLHPSLIKQGVPLHGNFAFSEEFFILAFSQHHES